MAGGFGTTIEVTLDSGKLAWQLEYVLNVFRPTNLAAFLDVEADQVIKARAAARFASEGDDASGRWLQLSPTTARFRKWQGVSEYHPINRRTDRLMNWLLGASPDITVFGGGADYTWPGNMPGDTVTSMKFETAQLGRNDPLTYPRPVVASNINDHRLVYDAFADWVVGEFALAGI